VVLLLALVFVSATGLGAVGLGSSMSVPASSGARGIALGGMISLIISSAAGLIFSIMLISTMFSKTGSRDEGAGILYLMLFTLCSLQVGFILCEYFQAILAKHLNNKGIQASVIAHTAFWAVGPTFAFGVSSLGALLGVGGGG